MTTPKSVLWGSFRGSAASASARLGLSRDLLSLLGVMAKSPGASLGDPGWRQQVEGGGTTGTQQRQGSGQGKKEVGTAAELRAKEKRESHSAPLFSSFSPGVRRAMSRDTPNLPSPCGQVWGEGCQWAERTGKTSDTGADFQKPGCMPCFCSLFSFV